MTKVAMTKQTVKLSEMLADQLINGACKICADASDLEIAFMPIVIVAGFVKVEDIEAIDGEPAQAMHLGIVDFRAPPHLPQGAIAHVIGEAFKSINGQPPSEGGEVVASSFQGVAEKVQEGPIQ